VVGHQEAGAKRPDHLHLVTHLQVAHVVAGHAPHRLALVVFQHALDGQRQVVVARPLAIARAGYRVLAGMVRTALGIDARGDHADRLPLEHREREVAEVEHHMMGVVIFAHLGDAHIAGHGGGDELLGGLGAVEVGVGMGCRPGRQGGAILGAVETLALTGPRRCGAGGWGLFWCGHSPRGGQLFGTEFVGQVVPAQLGFDRVGQRPWHVAPVVDRACGARRHTGHAQVALVGVDHVIARVVGDGPHRAGGLAGVAADADLGVDQMLPDDLGFAHVHGCLDLLWAVGRV